jgi:hypothetical protein
MATAQRRSTGVDRFRASDEVIKWIESVAGLVAHVKANYGGVPELIEHPQWDESRNEYTVRLLTGLKKEIVTLTKDFNDHVNQRLAKHRR